MCKLKAADFYCGAFVSALLNSPGGRPTLFDETDSRRIYRFETNNNDECYFYVKYNNRNQSNRVKHWIFNFTQAEIEKLLDLHQQGKKVQFALIGIEDGFVNSELAIVDYDDAVDCLGINRGIAKNYRINIKSNDGQHGLRMYGSGRSDRINGKDNTLAVSRQALEQL